MVGNRVAKRYAKSFFLISVEKKNLDEVYTEIVSILGILRKNREINDLLASPVIPEEKKLEFVNKLLGSSVSGEIAVFMRFLAEKRRLSILESVCVEFLYMYDTQMNYLDLEVTVPLELGKKQRDELVRIFSEKTGKKIRIHEKRDPSILGGIKVKADDAVIDGSVMHLLSRLSKKLKN